MALVLIANKVRVEEHVAHPVGQGEAAVRALFGGSRACTGPDGEVDGRIECGNASNARGAQLRSYDEAEVAACRKATESDAVRIVDLGLGKDVVDQVLCIVAGGREGMFGRLAIVGIDEGAVRAELLEHVRDESVVVAEIGQHEAGAVPGDVDGQRGCHAVRGGRDALGAVDVCSDGAVLVARGDVYDVALECVRQRRSVAVNERTQRVERAQDEHHDLETQVAQAPVVKPLVRDSRCRCGDHDCSSRHALRFCLLASEGRDGSQLSGRDHRRSSLYGMGMCVDPRRCWAIYDLRVEELSRPDAIAAALTRDRAGPGEPVDELGPRCQSLKWRGEAGDVEVFSGGQRDRRGWIASGRREGPSVGRRRGCSRLATEPAPQQCCHQRVLESGSQFRVQAEARVELAGASLPLPHAASHQPASPANELQHPAAVPVSSDSPLRPLYAPTLPIHPASQSPSQIAIANTQHHRQPHQPQHQAKHNPSIRKPSPTFHLPCPNPASTHRLDPSELPSSPRKRFQDPPPSAQHRTTHPYPLSPPRTSSMSPRSSDSNATSSKQKKKQVESNPPAPSPPVDQPSQPSTPALPPTVAPPAVSASAHRSPRVFVASALKPVSAIDTVTSTISAISHHANRGISSLIAAHSTATHDATSPQLAASSTTTSTPLRTDGSVSPIYDAFHNAGTPVDPARVQAALSHVHPDHTASRKPAPALLWSRWDRLPHPHHPHAWLPLLISYFDDGCLQALLVQDRNISELLCIPQAAQALLLPHSLQPSANAHLLTAFVRHPLPDSTDIQLFFVLQHQSGSTHLLAYSLDTHQVQASVHLQHHFSPSSDQPATTLDRVDAQINHRYLVLSFASPPSVHVLSAATLEYLQPPLLDAASPAQGRPTPISLSGRLLAYACTTPQHLSPVRFDARKTSNASFQDTSRSYVAPQPHASARVGEMRDNLFDTSAHVGDAARRIRGGVMSGVRTLGEWGSSYWPNPGSPPNNAAFSPSQPSLLSQSAPHNPHPPRPASSASSSPSLPVVDSARANKRLSSGSTVAPLTKSEVNAQASASNPNNACVRILDLGSDARTVCAFAPSTNAVALVAFSPCGRMILTADVLGHAFNVFELPLVGAFASGSQPSASTLLHRYKLLRGITLADVVRAEWSPDAQWIAIGTRSGSVHVFAVNPFGGEPSIANHVLGKVRNPRTLQPFGISLHSTARSVRPHPSAHQDAAAQPSAATRMDAGLATQALATPKYCSPSFIMINVGSSSSAESGADASTPFELLTNDPRSHTITQHALRCWSSQSRTRVAVDNDEPMHSVSLEAKRRFASSTSPRSSGLTHMMRKAGEGLLSAQNNPRLQAECVRVALWDHLLPDTDAVIKHSLTALFDHRENRPKDRSDDIARTRSSSIAKAEIETYSQSPRHASQLHLSLPPDLLPHAHARHRQADGSSSIDPGSNAALHSETSITADPGAPHRSHRLARAVVRGAELLRRQPGQRGRSSGWTAGSSIPIRIVAGGLGGIYRAGKELGRGVEMARRRTSGASRTAVSDVDAHYAADAGPSVSFDGEDDVDLLGEDEGLGASRKRHYAARGSVEAHLDAASMPSQASLMSTLRNDGQLRGSQPSSAETPSTRFSEADDAGADGGSGSADDCDWDAIEASRSPAAMHASLSGQSGGAAPSIPGGLEPDSLEDDFTVGRLDEDSGQSTVTQSLSNILALSAGAVSKAVPPKELVYALPANTSTRSSLLGQSTGLAGAFEARGESKDARLGVRDASPSHSDGGADSGSQMSAASGLLCEGSKETFTPETASIKVAEEPSPVQAVAVPKISTSDGADEEGIASLWLFAGGDGGDSSLVEFLVLSFPGGAVAVVHGALHALVGDGVVAVVEDGQQTSEPVGGGSEQGEEVGEAGQHEVLRETRVEAPHDALGNLDGFQHGREEGIGMILHTVTQGGSDLGGCNEGSANARGVVARAHLDGQTLVECQRSRLGSGVFGHGRKRSIRACRRDCNDVTVVARNHVGRKLLGGDPVGERVDAPQTLGRVEIDVKDGVARRYAGTVDEHADLLAAKPGADLLAHLGHLLAVRDVGLEVEDLGCARGSSNVGGRSHVEHRNVRLLLVAEELDDLLADTLGAAGDDDNVVGIVDGIAPPLGVVAVVSVERTVDGADEDEGPDVAHPLVLGEDERAEQGEQLVVGGGDGERRVGVLVVEQRECREEREEGRGEGHLAKDAEHRVKGEWLTELERATPSVSSGLAYKYEDRRGQALRMEAVERVWGTAKKKWAACGEDGRRSGNAARQKDDERGGRIRVKCTPSGARVLAFTAWEPQCLMEVASTRWQIAE
ncbi:hypothetical protein L1887_58072 [Cichorium endivia]|nr:hypothetical protein L1887_58072 [Cichorium endivia]